MARIVPGVVVAAVLAALAVAPAAGAQTAAERELVRRYTPILMQKTNPAAPCSRKGEQYRLAPVDIALGNPGVRLVRPRSRDGFEQARVLARAPTAADLAGLGPDYYLDLPGKPRRPGCVYARDSERLMDGRASVTYAHIAREPGVRGLVVQYWFYYWFNQFNDLHESDWEMMQVAFDAPTAEEALERGPVELAYAQHNGGERRRWDDPSVEKEGTRPVVHVSSGSHASQYSSALFLGNGRGGSGLGCDDTRSPSTRVDPRAVLVSTFPQPGADDEWLTYRGHWGQHEPGVSNGPTGPNTKRQWLEPFRWMSKLRTSTPVVPQANGVGEPVSGFFCGAVSTASSFLNDTSSSPLAFLVLVAALALAFLVPILRTTWRPVVTVPLRRRRAGGQIVDTAARAYLQHWRAFVPLGLVAVPIGGLAVAGQALLFHSTGLRRAFDALESDKAEGLVALFVGSLAHALTPLLVGAAVVLLVRELDAGGSVHLGVVLRGELWRLFGLALGALLVVSLLCWTVIGIPYAIKKAVDWAVLQQAAGFEGRRGREAFAGSTGLVRGQWRRVAGIGAVLLLLLAVSGPFTALAVIFVTDGPLATINLFASLLFVLVLPFVSIAVTLLYLDLAVRRDSKGTSAGMLPAP